MMQRALAFAAFAALLALAVRAEAMEAVASVSSVGQRAAFGVPGAVPASPSRIVA